MATIIEQSDEGLKTQLNTFCGKIDNYTLILGLTAGDVTSIKNDNKFFSYVLDGVNAFRTFAQTMTGYKDLLRYGKEDEVLPAFPTIPTLPAAPAAVVANIQKRFARLIQDCVNSSNYTKSIGEDLGIEAPTTPFDPNTGKPKFKIEFSSGGQPDLIWKKGKFQGVEIWKDTGTGLKFLDKDFSPDYIDKSPLPAAGVSAVWKYKMIYLYKDEVVGNWSDEVSTTVYGNV